MSRNSITLHQLELACQNVLDLLEAGMTENMAIRNLEQFANVYAKLRVVGSASPDNVHQYETWSVSAREQYQLNPNRRPGEYLRVEHGTPRRQFARLILKGFKDGLLTEAWLNELCDLRWKVAVITHEEDKRLSRSAILDNPADRWRLANIEFGD